jgi:uncharacterized protein YhjY with autotransporter beta-barrel domain
MTGLSANRISLFVIVIYMSISLSSFAYAECDRSKSRQWNNIVCTGLTDGGVQGSNKKDIILITNGSDVTNNVNNISGRLADASATGVDGKNGKDLITNEGNISVSASSAVMDGKVGDEFGVDSSRNITRSSKKDDEKNNIPSVEPLSDADAVGITGGNGKDEIRNKGIVDVTANASASSLINFGSITGSKGSVHSMAAGIEGDRGKDTIHNDNIITVNSQAGIGTLTVSPSLNAGQTKKMKTDVISAAAGIGGGEGKDIIINNGDINIISTSSVQNLNLSINATGSSSSDSEINVYSEGRGIDGGSGNDRIVNKGLIEASAISSTSGNVIFHLDDYGAIKSILNVNGDAVGITGGDGNDNIVNEDTILVTFSGTLTLNNISADLLNNGSVDSTLAISGGAKGIAGSAGNDRIVNKKDITVSSVSSLDLFNLGLTGISWHWNTEEKGGVFSHAYAAGISGGHGNDNLVNDGKLTVDSSAYLTYGNLLLTGADFADYDVSALAEAEAAGIDGGYGKDRIINLGDMFLNSNSGVDMVGVTVTGFLLPWDTKGNGGLFSKAYATGLDGNRGNDLIRQKGYLEVNSRANSTVTDFTFDLVKLGSTDLSLQSISAASGITGGLGSDRVINENYTKVLSTAKANRLNVAFSGVSIGVLSDNDLSTSTSATSSGIMGDEGDDFIRNKGTIRTDSSSQASTESFNLDLFNLDLGFIGAPDFTAKTEALSYTEGLDGGIGNDRIYNLGTVDANAHSNSFALNADTSWKNLSLSFLELFGLDFGNAKVNATTDAVGIIGREGNDRINNSSVVKSISTATANSVGVGISIDLLGIGGERDNEKPSTSNMPSALASFTEDSKREEGDERSSDAIQPDDDWNLIGDDKNVDPTLTVLNGNTIAQSNSTGIAGGQGDDIIKNSGSVTTNATSRSSVSNVSLNVSFIDIIDPTDFIDIISLIVAPLTLDYVNASSAAGAAVWGLSGGDGNDSIFNTGSTDVKADSFTNSLSTIIDLQVAEIGIALGGNVTGSRVEGMTWATGIDGGLGDDSIINEGTVLTNSDAAANSIDVTALVAGVFGGLPVQAALTDSSTKTVSESTGIAGGEGDDRIINRDDGSITANGTSEAYAESISVEFKLATAISNFGASLSKATTDASSSVTAIDGGDGEDRILNEGIVNSKATSETNGVTVSVRATGLSFMNLANLGAAFADVSVKSAAETAGIRGGTGSDKITNGGNLKSESIATLNGASISVSSGGINASSPVMGGAALARTNATASSDTTGIDGGEGNDRIDNYSSVHAKSTTDATAGAVSVLVDQYGAALTDTRLTATADATAIDGGDGSDIIANRDSIIVENISTGRAADVSVNLVSGFASALSDTTVKANAAGIKGGDDRDVIENTGTIWIDNDANAYSTGVSVDIFGVASAYGGVNAEASSTGIDGGAALDSHNLLINSYKIDSDATSFANAVGTTVNIIGHSYSNAQATATSKSAGIQGGIDSDKVINSGIITSKGSATANGGSVNVDLIGNAPADAGTIAAAEASAIDSDAGKDEIYNTGSLIANSTSKAHAGTTSVNLIGAAKADGGTTSTASSIGINGGDEMDMIMNMGNITVDSSATTDATNGTVNIIGAAILGGAINATANAAGIEGGTGDDSVLNSGNIKVTSDSKMILNNTSFDFGFASLAGGRLTANNYSAGMSGGDGDDRLINDGVITVDATAELDSSGNVKAVFGYSGANGTTGAVTRATGIDGGAGEDYIKNLDTINVTSGSTLTMDGSTYTFGGVAGLGDNLTSSTFSTGVSGGGGPNQIWNEGDMTVKALSNLDSKGGSKVTFGSSSAVSRITADTTARGIDGGDLEDIIVNSGDIDVDASSIGTSNKSSYVFVGGTVTDAVLTAKAYSYGISSNGGADLIINKGMITVKASSDMQSIGGSHADFGTSKGSGKVSSSATARGIYGGDGDDYARNEGTIKVEAKSYGYSKHNAETGILFGKGDSRTRADSNVYGYGIDMGAGNNTVLNEHNIYVNVAAEANTDASGAGADIADGDVYSEANSTVNARAAGIMAGDGDNLITNKGLLDVRTTLTNMSPLAYSSASADGNGIDGDGSALSVAIVNTHAAGIQTGNGDNYIVNDNDITVQAIAHSMANAFADADWFGSASVTRTGSVTSRGFGILAGNGNNHIINNGNISVTGSYGTNITTFQQAPIAEAYGIKTGSGDDIIVNNGSITTTVVRNSDIESGVGIDSGAGNDQVYLMYASSVSGSINLGANNDELIVGDTATVTKSISGGSGRDTVIFDGAGNFSLTYQNFEKVIKQNSGTFTVPELPSLERLVVSEGVLQVGGDYQFLVGQSMQVDLNGHGTSGRLQIDGATTLDGNLTVTKGRGAYIDGDSFDIISSNNPLQESFAYVVLPDPTPLLSFEIEQEEDSITVKALSKSFTTVASNESEKQIAEYMDRVMPSSTGDFSDVMGQFQGLQGQDFSMAFSSMNPNYYSSTTKTSFNIARQYTAALQNRIQTVRINGDAYSIAPQLAFSTGENTLLLAYSGSDASIQQLSQLTYKESRERKHSLWLKGYGQWGDQDGVDGSTGFDFDISGVALGIDRVFNNKFIVGLSFGASNTDVELDSDLGNADIDSAMGSVYGSYFTNKGYLEAVLSYGKLGYDNNRNIFIGPLKRTADSDHDANMYSAFISGGYTMNINDLLFQPFTSLQYTLADEDSFTEDGAVALNLNVEERRTDSLTSELGLRITRPLEIKKLQIIPEASAAWIYDFDIDSRMVTASFTGSPDTKFTVDGAVMEKNGAILGAAVTFISNNILTTSLSYSAELRSDYYVHGLLGEVQISF